LCARDNERQKIFRDERDQKRFLELLEVSLKRYGIALYGFVLLPNHFHFIACTPRAEPVDRSVWGL
jgi:REP element-mobilizing transposase RayT